MFSMFPKFRVPERFGQPDFLLSLNSSLFPHLLNVLKFG